MNEATTLSLLDQRKLFSTDAHLQQRQGPQPPDLHAAQRGARHQHAHLVQRLVPEDT